MCLSMLFVVIYGGCAWITSRRTDVNTWYYAWESMIPFVPVMIIPYMSINLFFVGGPFLCRSRHELGVLAKRITYAILVAGLCFLLLPLQYSEVPQPPADWTGAIFRFLRIFDQPNNLFPSLHIAFRTILADLYARHTTGVLRWVVHGWFVLIGFSTLLTAQHHVADIVGGFALAGVCFYFFRYEAAKPA